MLMTSAVTLSEASLLLTGEGHWLGPCRGSLPSSESALTSRPK